MKKNLILAIILSVSYLAYLLGCPYDQCTLGKTIPLIKVILQIGSTIFLLIVFRQMTAIRTEKNAKAGSAADQVVLAKSYLRGSGRKKNEKKAYLWAFIAAKSKHLSPGRSQECNRILQALALTLNDEAKKDIEARGNDFIMRMAKNSLTTGFRGRKHEATTKALITSSILLCILIGSFFAIPVFFMPNQARFFFEDSITTSAVVGGYEKRSSCLISSAGDKCGSARLKFKDQYGDQQMALADDNRPRSYWANIVGSKIQVVYLASDPSVVMTKENRDIGRIIFWFFGIIIVFSCCSHIYICILNWIYRMTDNRAAATTV